MFEQREEAKSGCFSRFFSLLLCAHSSNAPPIHPSDHLPPPQTLPSLPNKSYPVPGTPGLVARLMGLDSLPNTSRVSSRVSPDSVPRSKSVNFIDYLLQFDPNRQEQQGSHHRRVRTASFREVPALSSSSARSLSFQAEKNNDVGVFLWDDADKAARESRPGEIVRPSSKKQEALGLKESKKQGKEKNEGTKKKKKISKLKNEPRRRVSVSSPRMREEEFVEPRFRKKVRSKKTTYLSPVSVLDVGDGEDFPLQNKITKFTEETIGMASKSKTKGESSAERGISKTSEARDECSELMAMLRKLAENDVHQMFDRSSVGWNKGVFGSDDCFQEIPLHLEHNIFNLLLHELVHDLL